MGYNRGKVGRKDGAQKTIPVGHAPPRTAELKFVDGYQTLANFY